MAGFNKAILVGNLGSDPQIRTIESGVKVASFSIATTETYLDKDNNRQEKTEWHRIVAWRGLAELAEKFLKKGTRVFIEGKITNRTYEQDGVTKNICEIVASNMVLMSAPQGGGSYSSVPPPSEEYARPVNNPSSHVGNKPAHTTTQTPEPRDNDVVINDPTDDLPF
jgi:single-strand DNA-binding protein